MVRDRGDDGFAVPYLLTGTHRGRCGIFKNRSESLSSHKDVMKFLKKNLVFPYHLIGSGEIFVKILVVSLSFNKEWQKNFGHCECPILISLVWPCLTIRDTCVLIF